MGDVEGREGLGGLVGRDRALAGGLLGVEGLLSVELGLAPSLVWEEFRLATGWRLSKTDERLFLFCCGRCCCRRCCGFGEDGGGGCRCLLLDLSLVVRNDLS